MNCSAARKKMMANGVIFHTSATITMFMARNGSLSHARYWERMCSRVSTAFSTPYSGL